MGNFFSHIPFSTFENLQYVDGSTNKITQDTVIVAVFQPLKMAKTQKFELKKIPFLTEIIKQIMFFISKCEKVLFI